MSLDINLSQSTSAGGLHESLDGPIVFGGGSDQSQAREPSGPLVAKDSSFADNEYRPDNVVGNSDQSDGTPSVLRGLRRLRSNVASGARENLDKADFPGEPATDKTPGTLLVSIIGSSGWQRRVRGQLVVFCSLLIATVAMLWLQLSGVERIAQMNTQVGEATTQLQRIRSVLTGLIVGDADAAKVANESQGELSIILDGLESRRELEELPEGVAPIVAQLRSDWVRTASAISLVLQNQTILKEAAVVRDSALAASTSMLASAEAIVQDKLKAAQPSATDVALAGNLAVQTQRVAKETALRLSPESDKFGQPGDILATLTAFDGRLLELTGNSRTTRLYADQIRSQLDNFSRQLEQTLSNGQDLIAAQQAGLVVQDGSSQMINAMVDIQKKFESSRQGTAWFTLAAAVLGLLAALSALSLSRAYMKVSDDRTNEAMRQKEVAEQLQAEAKRMNDQNQAAILRLMNELQEVADGDLTVEATVSEDITGAIADSVNYTVEELRSLVSRINSTAEMVNKASASAHVQMSNLQQVSQTQFADMKQTGQSVLQMARQINNVSEQASASVQVARQSVSASQAGSEAVNNAITGMNSIRDQIQETAKRIKRLGESSQEIGEIVEVISELSEQTNMLALNAAIQAASAGEAGRGFTIVAEEVQRLAERSAEATKQISGLIKTIQADTHDAVAAMERSTEGVVKGTRRSDEAGNALEQIGTVSTQLAEMIEQISETSSQQAASAGTVARSIHNILLVTKQSAEGTIQTAGSIQQLSTLSHELKNSVARFKVV